MPFQKGSTIGKEFRFVEGHSPWNKDKKGAINSGSFRKGHKLGFKKGYTPWNKKERHFVFCACGCGKKFVTPDEFGNDRKYIWGHFVHTEEFRKIMNNRLGGKLPKNILNFNKSHFKRIGLLGIKEQSFKAETSIEKIVYQELQRRGILFEKQKIINSKFIVDVFIPRLNLIIEVDGNYWHNLDRVVKKDRAENAYLRKCGFNLIRLKEREIRNGLYLDKIGEVI